jgi:hypothetical protein
MGLAMVRAEERIRREASLRIEMRLLRLWGEE